MGIELTLEQTAISGVYFQPLAILPTAAGPVLHFLRKTFPLYPENGIGEIYFSEILPGQVKAWKMHKKQAQLLAAPAGLIKLVLYDARTDSETNGAAACLFLGRPDHYGLVNIPPGICYGFSCVSQTNALICNCPDMPHDPQESEKLPLEHPGLPCRLLLT